LDTFDDHSGDGERSASVKSINYFMNYSKYCGLKELRFFEKSLNINFFFFFLQIHPSEPSCSMRADRQTVGWTDGHDETDSRFSQRCEHV
jgi:hypothetical protein